MVNEIKNKFTARKSKRESYVRLFLVIIIVVLFNMVGGYFFHRFDLTSEKRYTVTPATKELLKKTDDVIYFRVYLEGDFPSGFRRLRNATREMLDEMRTYSRGNIEYEFIDPSSNPDEKERVKLYRQLAEKGLRYTTLEEKDKGAKQEKIIFPGALVKYRNQEYPVQLLKSSVGMPPEVMLNQSVEALEYELANAVRQVTVKDRMRIAFLRGHGEAGNAETADIRRSLRDFYDLDTVRIEGKLGALKGYQALIVADPDSMFTEKDKFIIDQYVMRGGKVIWVVDPMIVDLDSLRGAGEAIAIDKQLNLDDMLFKYGVRVNHNLIMDLQSSAIPMVTGYIGNQPRQAMMPWYFFPVLTPVSDHPVVKNLNAVRCEFVSSIDTVRAEGVKKSILLSTSRYSRLAFAPVRVSLNVARSEPDERQYSRPPQPVAVLLEGVFPSLYARHVPEEISGSKEIDFREMSVPGKMLVVSDGAFIRNHYNPKTGAALPLGFDRFIRQSFGNKDFMLNAVDYMLNESGLIAARTRDVKLRMLDRKLAEEEKTQWQIVNTAGPVILVLLAGWLVHVLRIRKYAR